MFDHIKIAIEAIDYQTSNSLAKKLINVVQDGFDLVKSELPEDMLLKHVDKPTFKNITTLLSGSVGKSISELLSKETNCTIKIIFDPYIGADAASMPTYKDTKVSEIMDSYDKMKGLPTKPSKNISGVIQVLSKGFDKSTGKINKKYKELYEITIFLSIGLFLTHRTYVENDTLLAHHIAAIIMHELGHGISFVEKLGWGYHQATLANDSIAYHSNVKNNNSLSHLKKEAKKVLNLISDKSRKTAYTKIIETAKDPEACANFLTSTVAETLIGAVFAPVQKSMSVYALRKASLHPMSETVVTTRNTSEIERAADEYAARYGVSGSLAGALARITKYDNYNAEIRNDKSSELHGAMLNLTIVKWIVSLGPVYPDIPGTSNYDGVLTRLRLIIQDTLSVFKNMKLTDEERNRWIRYVNEAKIELAEYEQLTSPKVQHFLWNTMFRMDKSNSTMGAIVNANVMGDYSTLQNITKQMIRSPLWFHAAVLKSIQQER